ncbi:uncharacterized protein LOC131843654 [Achroia grisella]|uniref:uncharacterized protein LOC131843654 n=1 Tax=Achroia grisella TaxID=688607 RepID=UPI0027D2D412|nr:uncharacterized protein LOC131843654 [Achroia grisella]
MFASPDITDERETRYSTVHTSYKHDIKHTQHTNMFITLLFISQVQCEWVQISQQHYMKPYKPSYNPTAITEAVNRKGEAYESAYVNESLAHMWNKGTVDKVSHKGIVSRVQPDLMESARKPANNGVKPSAPNIDLTKHPNRRYNSDKDAVEALEILAADEEFKNKYAFKKEVYKLEDSLQFVSSTQENEYNIHESASTVKHQYTRPQVYEERLKNYNPSVTKVKPNVQSDFEHKPVQNGEVITTKSIIKTSPDYTSPADSDKSNDKFSSYSNIDIWDKPNLKSATQSYKHDQLPDISLQRPLKGPANRIYLISSTEKVANDNLKEKNAINAEINVLNDKLTRVKDLRPLKAEFVTKKEEFEDIDSEATVSDESDNLYFEKSPGSSLNEKEDLNDEEQLTNEKTLDKMGNVIKFMKVVAETISKNSHRSVDSKIKYLENLKNTIVANIEYRIETLWPDDTVDPKNTIRRKARAAQQMARGHVEIPSAESALMTISFLTFAVYLIKLVLQVIQTYKNKTMMVAPAVVATVGRAASAVLTRRHTGR